MVLSASKVKALLSFPKFMVATTARPSSNAASRKCLKVGKDEAAGVKNIVMASPKTRNSLSLEMLQELCDEVHDEGGDVRSIVIRGEGKAFSAGHNLKEMTEAEGSDYHAEIFRQCNRLMERIVRAPVPVIAAVDGVAAAAGCQLVAMCDMAVATRSSSFSVPGAGVGLFCSTPGIPLARAVPRKMSAYMLFTGNPISAEEAFRAGLISKVSATPEELEKDITAICLAVQSKPKAVIALGKRFYYEQLEMGLTDAFEAGGKVMVDNLKLKDAQEGIAAFKEKRKPSWTHQDG